VRRFFVTVSRGRRKRLVLAVSTLLRLRRKLLLKKFIAELKKINF
jgi:hypothetical protein